MKLRLRLVALFILLSGSHLLGLRHTRGRIFLTCPPISLMITTKPFVKIKTNEQKELTQVFNKFIVNANEDERGRFMEQVDRCCENNKLLKTLAFVTVKQNIKNNEKNSSSDHALGIKLNAILADHELSEEEKIVLFCSIISNGGSLSRLSIRNDLKKLRNFFDYCLRVDYMIGGYNGFEIFAKHGFELPESS